MSDSPGPWDRDPPRDTPPTRLRHRRWLWLALMAALGLGLWQLARAFPDSVDSTDRWAWVARSAGILIVLSAGLLSVRRIDWGQKARHAAIWIGIATALCLAAAYRDEIVGVGQHLRSEFSGSYPVAIGAHELVVTQNDAGGFFIMGKVNGQPVRFLIDTGSSETVLSPADAHRLGLDTAGLHFDRSAETANGIGFSAPIKVDSVGVGSIELTNLPVLINQAPMSTSLLGMSFLSQLESFQVRGRKLYLKSRG